MKLNYKKIAAVSILALGAMPANSAIITHGYLTTDDTTNYITDTNSGRMYTRFDVNGTVKGQDGVRHVSDTFEGWSIATSEVADDFFASMLGLNASTCEDKRDSNINAAVCGTITGWNDGDFGASYDSIVDYFAYSDNLVNPSSGVHIGEISPSGGSSSLIMNEDVPLSIQVSTAHTSHFLLYKDSPTSTPEQVPEPATLSLLTLGLAGLSFTRKQKKY